MKRISRRILSLAALTSIAVAACLWAVRPELPLALRMVRTLTVAAIHLGTPAALAQESLKFQPVPAESLNDLEAPRPPRPPASLTVGDGTNIKIKSGDIMRVGSDITIEADQEVQGDVLAIRGDVTVDGHVEGNVVSMGGDIYLSETARVDGDVVCMGGKLHEDTGAIVGGQRVTALDPEGRRRLHPRRIHIQPGWEDEGASGKLVFYLIMLGLVWALCKIAPNSTRDALASLNERPAESLGLGMLVWLLAVPSLIALSLVVAILCITIIGIPLAIVALLGYFVFFALLVLWGYAVGAAALGERLLQRRGETNPGLARSAVAGVIAIGGVSIIASVLKWMDVIPLVGVLSGLITATVVLGSIVLMSMGAGAWMRTEFTTGTLGRWWRGSGNRLRRTPPPPPSGGGSVPPTGGPGGPGSGGAAGPSSESGGSGTGGSPGQSPGPGGAGTGGAPSQSPGFGGSGSGGTSASSSSYAPPPQSPGFAGPESGGKEPPAPV